MHFHAYSNSKYGLNYATLRGGWRQEQSTPKKKIYFSHSVYFYERYAERKSYLYNYSLK